MKKIYSILLTLLLALGLMLVPATAASAQSNSNRVVDDADLLTPSEESELEAKLAKWCDSNKFDIVIVTNYNGYSQDTSDQKLVTYADDYYDYNNYGYGENYDGCILVIDMGSREFYIGTTGYGITALTDYGIDKIKSDMTDDLSDGDYEDAIEDGFIDNVVWMYQQAKDGTPYDYVAPKLSDPAVWGGMLGIAIPVGLIIGLIFALSNKRQLKSVRRRYEARSYVRNGSMNLTREYDRFLYSNIVAKPKPKDNDNNHGGSMTHTSSSGRVHGGGGGHF